MSCTSNPPPEAKAELESKFTRDFTLYASMAEEAHEGWIWLYSHLPTRTIVKVTNDETHRSVYCASRNIDYNFRNAYNESPKRRWIQRCDLHALVMSEWYRDALGGLETTARSGKRVKLTIAASRLPLWGAIRAACHHPDLVARIGTRLGILGAWLGLIGLVQPLLSLCVKPDDVATARAQIVVALIGGVVGWLACRGVKLPERGTKRRPSP